MTPEQAAAFVQAQAASAAAELEAMKLANLLYFREIDCNIRPQPPYSPEDFQAVADRFMLGYNTVVQVFQDANQYSGR